MAARLSVNTIDRFIPDDSPLGRAGDARMLVQATGGNLRAAAFLAALARKESSFGAQAFVPNNFWGWGIHAGSSVNRAPSVAAMAQRVWKGLSSPTGPYAKAKTPRQAINIYAPPIENNTGQYQSQVDDWLPQMGVNPDENFRGGGGGMPAGAGFAAPAGLAAPAAGGGATDRLGLLAAIRGLHKPGANRIESLSNLIALKQGGGGGAPTAAAPAGPMPSNQFAKGATFGVPGAMPGGAGGDWGGSMERALAISQAVGIDPSSQKRSRKYTATGGISDHWTGSTNSYAVDLPTAGAAGDREYRQLMSYLERLQPGNQGIARAPSGSWQNFNIGGYRYNVGWRTPGHFDHVHAGVERVTGR